MRKIIPKVFLACLALLLVAALMAFFVEDDGQAAIAGLAFIFGVVGTFVSGFAWLILKAIRSNEAKDWTDGRVGVGTVRHFQHSGLKRGVRNYRIYMTVESEDGTTFDGVLNATVGRRNLNEISPGSMLPVIFQAAKPHRLLAPHGPLKKRAQLMYDYVCQRDGLLSQEMLNAGYFGQPCRAVVQDLVASAARQGTRIGWDLTLQVFTPDGHQFPARSRMFLNEAEWKRVKAAQYVEAKYLPGSPAQVATKIPAT